MELGVYLTAWRIRNESAFAEITAFVAEREAAFTSSRLLFRDHAKRAIAYARSPRKSTPRTRHAKYKASHAGPQSPRSHSVKPRTLTNTKSIRTSPQRWRSGEAALAASAKNSLGERVRHVKRRVYST